MERGDSDGRLDKYLENIGFSDDTCIGPFASVTDAEDALRRRGWVQREGEEHSDEWTFSLDETESVTVTVDEMELVSSDRLPAKP